MINNPIPFKIGEQYEVWEFDLEPIFNNQDEVYLYIGTKYIDFLGIPIDKILLSFSLDILTEVEYQFQITYFDELVTILSSHLSPINSNIIFSNQKYSCQISNLRLELMLESDMVKLVLRSM